MKIQVIIYGLEELKEVLSKKIESVDKGQSLLGILLIVTATMVALTDYNIISLVICWAVLLFYGLSFWDISRLRRSIRDAEEAEHGFEICTSDCISIYESDTVTVGSKWKFSLVLHEDMKDGTVNLDCLSREAAMSSNTAQELRLR